jgi:hypothetical protein
MSTSINGLTRQLDIASGWPRDAAIEAPAELGCRHDTSTRTTDVPRSGRARCGTTRVAAIGSPPAVRAVESAGEVLGDRAHAEALRSDAGGRYPHRQERSFIALSYWPPLRPMTVRSMLSWRR